MKILIILSLFLFGKISGQQPPDLCKGDKLFRMNDRYCYSFSDLCFKTGDDQCNQILKACEQCPPSNITLAMLRNIWEMSMVQSNLTKEIINKKTPNTFEQFTLTMTNKSKESSPTFSNDSCAILLWIIIIILVVHFVEIRFKLFTKCFQLCKTKDQYTMVKSRKRKYLNELEIKINQSLDLNTKEIADLNKNNTKELADIKRNVESLSQELSDHINYLKNYIIATPQNNQKIKFSVEGSEHKSKELFVHNRHNIVHLKQRLCAFLLNAKDNDYKRMQLKYNGRILNDNEYLLKYIDSSNKSVNYVINTEIDPSEILVLKLKGKMGLPNIIQIYKNESVKKLLSIIGDLIATSEFKAYLCNKNDKYTELSKSNNNGDNKTLNDFCLSDGNVVNVVTIEKGELRLKSIFDENDSFLVTYSNIDQISTFLKDKNNDDFILFDSTENIDENQFIFHFDISSDSQVKFCQFKRYENITDNVSISTGFKWEISYAKKNSEDIIIKKYDINVENLKNEEWVLNELKTFLITKSHPRFIQLNNVYKDNKSFYISMENMSGGILNKYLKKDKEFDSIQIFKWAAQILEGLEFLHENKIVHRDLNPSNILVDNYKSLKLSNFNLSKFNENGLFNYCSIIGKDKQLSFIKLRYMAPEILGENLHDNKCDVWSFGAVLVKIVTGKKPYPKLSKDQAKKKIINSDKIEYDLPDKFDNRIKTFIDSCFSKDPPSRSKIEDLLKHEIIKNYNENVIGVLSP